MLSYLYCEANSRSFCLDNILLGENSSIMRTLGEATSFLAEKYCSVFLIPQEFLNYNAILTSAFWGKPMRLFNSFLWYTQVALDQIFRNSFSVVRSLAVCFVFFLPQSVAQVIKCVI